MGAFPHVSFAAKSDVGRKRKNNEDAFGVCPEAGIFCVADGMGGGDDGEVASAATVRAVERFAAAYPFPSGAAYSAESLAEGLCKAVNSASAWISERARANNLKGCGSTFVGVCLDASRPDSALALHAGDSRLYRIRGKSIQQITKDHSAAELIGAKDEKDLNPMFRGMILRAVGIQPKVEIELTPLPLKAGDIIIICSDGLYRMVPEKKIVSIVRDSDSPDSAVNSLIAAANEAGGVDNVTVVLVKVGNLPLPLPAVEMPPSKDGADAPTISGSSDASFESRDSETSMSFDVASEDGMDADPASFATETQTRTTGEGATGATLGNKAFSSDGASLVGSGWKAMQEGASAKDSSKLKKVILILIAAVIAVVTAIVAISTKTDDSASTAADAAREKADAELAEMRLKVAEATRKAQEEQRRIDEEKRKIDEAKKIKEEAERKAEEARVAAENERRIAEQKAAEQRAKEEAERIEKAKADAVRKAEEAARRKLEAERLAREEAERKAEAERIAREEAIRKAEAERKAREEAEKKAEAERKAREEAARKAEAERMAREEEARKAEAERKAREEAEKKAEAERKAREEEARKAEAERKAREEEARKAEAERKAREEAEKKAEAERLAREKAEKNAICERASPYLDDAWNYLYNGDVLDALGCFIKAKEVGYELEEGAKIRIRDAYNRKVNKLTNLVLNKNFATEKQRAKFIEEREKMESQWLRLFDSGNARSAAAAASSANTGK